MPLSVRCFQVRQSSASGVTASFAMWQLPPGIVAKETKLLDYNLSDWLLGRSTMRFLPNTETTGLDGCLGRCFATLL